jgi:hypothetical protein
VVAIEDGDDHFFFGYASRSHIKSKKVCDCVRGKVLGMDDGPTDTIPQLEAWFDQLPDPEDFWYRMNQDDCPVFTVPQTPEKNMYNIDYLEELHKARVMLLRLSPQPDGDKAD